MVEPVSPVRLLTNTPVPVPSDVLVSAVVGWALVLQQTPLSVTTAPPSDVTFPPPVAELYVILVTREVVIVGV